MHGYQILWTHEDEKLHEMFPQTLFHCVIIKVFTILKSTEHM